MTYLSLTEVSGDSHHSFHLPLSPPSPLRKARLLLFPGSLSLAATVYSFPQCSFWEPFATSPLVLSLGGESGLFHSAISSSLFSSAELQREEKPIKQHRSFSLLSGMQFTFTPPNCATVNLCCKPVRQYNTHLHRWRDR